MVQKNARPRGRPRSFDEGEALEKATRVFRAKGYDGATIDDLVAGMGVVRPSLYAVFGDKRTLFLRVLKAYAEKKGGPRRQGAAVAADASRVARPLPQARRRKRDRERMPPGCLLVCVAPLVDDAEVRQFLQNAAAGGAALVEGRFRDGITAGEIPSDFPVAVAQASSPILLVASPCVRRSARRARRSSGMPRRRPTCCSCRVWRLSASRSDDFLSPPMGPSPASRTRSLQSAAIGAVAKVTGGRRSNFSEWWTWRWGVGRCDPARDDKCTGRTSPNPPPRYREDDDSIDAAEWPPA